MLCCVAQLIVNAVYKVFCQYMGTPEILTKENPCMKYSFFFCAIVACMSLEGKSQQLLLDRQLKTVCFKLGEEAAI